MDRPSFLSCWWRATLIIFLLSAVIAFLTAGSAGFAYALGQGLLVSPFAGLFWGWIYWLAKKR